MWTMCMSYLCGVLRGLGLSDVHSNKLQKTVVWLEKIREN